MLADAMTQDWRGCHAALRLGVYQQAGAECSVSGLWWGDDPDQRATAIEVTMGVGHRVSLDDQAAALRAMAQDLIEEAQELVLEAHVLCLRARWLAMGKEISGGNGDGMVVNATE